MITKTITQSTVVPTCSPAWAACNSKLATARKRGLTAALWALCAWSDLSIAQSGVPVAVPPASAASATSVACTEDLRTGWQWQLAGVPSRPLPAPPPLRENMNYAAARQLIIAHGWRPGSVRTMDERQFFVYPGKHNQYTKNFLEKNPEIDDCIGTRCRLYFAKDRGLLRVDVKGAGEDGVNWYKHGRLDTLSVVKWEVLHGIPNLVGGIAYADARQQLLAWGWKPFYNPPYCANQIFDRQYKRLCVDTDKPSPICKFYHQFPELSSCEMLDDNHFNCTAAFVNGTTIFDIEFHGNPEDWNMHSSKFNISPWDPPYKRSFLTNK